MRPSDRERLQASVRQRLLDIARCEHADFQAVLTRYGLERLLYRLGCSAHREAFLLKGAFLFHAWQADVARPTRDLDLLGRSPTDGARLETVIAEITRGEVTGDGLDFPFNTIRAEPIREASPHQGIRIRLEARLGRTRIPLQLDVGFGDAAGARAVDLEYPTLLGHAPPRVLAYSPPYVAAEKLEAMITLGMVNTRLKDYYDLWRMIRTMVMPRAKLELAVQETFMMRGTAIPGDIPAALSDAFARDVQKARLWEAFLARNRLDAGGASLEEVVCELRGKFMPVLVEARRSQR
jgi:hypothetical protein